MDKTTRKATVFFALALICLIAIAPLREAGEVYSSVIRIHILPASDSRADQDLKLALRDELLTYSKEQLQGCTDRDRAEELLNDRMDEIEQLCNETLMRAGSDQKATLSLKEEYFDTRLYEDFSLPAGRYLSLQVKLGDGGGQNWWCVLFPPVCLETAKGSTDALLEAGVDKETVKTVTIREGEYRVRFRLLEMLSQAKEAVREYFE